MALTSKFVATDENGNVDSAFAVQLLEHLLQHTLAKDKAVRMRTCQLVGAILSSMGANLDVDDDLWDSMLEKMLARCRDKVPSVRAAAALAVSFFQDPEEADDPVVSELTRLMSRDASKDVRKTALQNIAITKATLPHVLRRLRDNKADVRKLLYQVIAWKMPIKKLPISLRCDILKIGLDERIPSVREACVDMLCTTWLADNLSSNPFSLLKCLDAEVNEKIATAALQAVFERFAKSRKRMSGPSPTEWDATANTKLAAATSGEGNLASVEALYIRVRVEWCKKQRGGVWQDAIDRLLLDLSSMTDLCNYHYQQCKTAADASEAERAAAETDICIARQLLQCIKMADFGDEGGRRQVVELIRGMLNDTETPSVLLESAMSCLKAAMMDESGYIRTVAEVISALKEPLTADESEDESPLLEQTWTQCLDMASTLLTSTQVRTAAFAQPPRLICHTEAGRAQSSMRNGELEGIETTLLIPAVQHREAAIRDKGVLALGQYCLLDKDVATRYLVLFLQAVRNDMEAIQHTAVKVRPFCRPASGPARAALNSTLLFQQVLFDLLFAFDLASIPTDATDDSAPATLQAAIMETLMPFLSSSSVELRTTAVEGVCKLMIANRINEPKLLSRLLILFYNPTTAEDVRLRQCLSVFFQAFAFSSPHHRICIEACFLPTLRVCVHAPKTSPLKEIALSDLAEYMLNLTNTAALPESCASQSGTAAEMAAGIHERLGVVLLNEVLSEPESIEARAFCKALNSLNLAPPNAEAKVDVESLSTLSVLAVSASEAVDNRFAKTALTKFQKDLNELTGLQGTPLSHYGHVVSAVLRALCANRRGGADRRATGRGAGADEIASGEAQGGDQCGAVQCWGGREEAAGEALLVRESARGRRQRRRRRQRGRGRGGGTGGGGGGGLRGGRGRGGGATVSTKPTGLST